DHPAFREEAVLSELTVRELLADVTD
ncbi:MAG: hypothetical protein JWN39_344, partial [Ilumatobacteraceae bacterium]|nr:hypothetical protein [Ilumatobacteraceae bacterium]